MTTMEAKIYYVHASHLLGRNAAGENVYFTSSGEAREAKVGDTLFFNPQVPTKLTRGDVTWFAKNARFVEFESEPGKPAVRIKGLPEASARHFDKQGNIKFGPRPADLAAQARAIRNASPQTR